MEGMYINMSIQYMYYIKLMDEIEKDFIYSDFYLRHKLMDISSIENIVYDMEDLGELGQEWLNNGLYKIEMKVKLGYNNYLFKYDYRFISYILYCSDTFVFNYYRSISQALNSIVNFVIINSDFNYKSELDTDTVLQFLFSSQVEISCDIVPGKILKMYEKLYYEWSDSKSLSNLDFIIKNNIKVKQMTDKTKVVISSNFSSLHDKYESFDLILNDLDIICNKLKNIFIGDKEIEFSLSFLSFNIRDNDCKSFIDYILLNADKYNFIDIHLHLKFMHVPVSESFNSYILSSFNKKSIFKSVDIDNSILF